MKIFIKLYVLLIAVILINTACNKDFGAGEIINYDNTIKSAIDTDPKFSFYKQLYLFHDSVSIKKLVFISPNNKTIPNMSGTLGTSYITAFIPTNDVFITNGITYISRGGLLNPALSPFISLNNLSGKSSTDSIYLLRQFVFNFISNNYHDLNGPVTLRSLGGAERAIDSLYIFNSNAGLLINGVANVELENPQKFKNGSLYTIDNLITPVFNGTFQQAVNVDTTLTTFGKLLAKVNNTTYTSYASTVLAPTNQAFKDAFYTDASINLMSAASAKIIVENHIIRSKIFSSQFVDGTITNVRGSSITIGTNPRLTFKSQGISTPANVISGNLLSIRSIIHKIDKVLKP